MVHCCQNSNLAFFLFDEKKNTCLYFLNLFPKSKNKKKPGTIAVNMVTLAPKSSWLLNIQKMSSLSGRQKSMRARLLNFQFCLCNENF